MHHIVGIEFALTVSRKGFVFTLTNCIMADLRFSYLHKKNLVHLDVPT